MPDDETRTRFERLFRTALQQSEDLVVIGDSLREQGWPDAKIEDFLASDRREFEKTSSELETLKPVCTEFLAQQYVES
jgi:hypothetical protein